MTSGGLLFVSGHDPEADARLVYRGRIGARLTFAEGRDAVRLATLNALASAQAAVRARGRLRRCVALTCFVDAVPAALDPAIVTDALALLSRALGTHETPVVWLRPVCGLAGGMPVEVELVLELAPLLRRQESW